MGSSVKSSAYLEEMLSMENDSDISQGISEVTQFHKGCNVLITGGTGFVGKLLIEKLLRSCPYVGKVYFIMRSKKGKTPDQRLKEHFDDVVYDRLRHERPDFLSHIVMIEGDTGLKDLGISDEDRKKLIENVHIVYHGAATVRFDESLKRALNINVRGTKLVLDCAKEMKNLKVFVHISTAFSHCIAKEIEEKFYDTQADPHKLLEMADILDDDLMEHITPKVVGKWPNTYAFSKAMGEELVRRDSKGIPICIVRPSIMIPTYREPVPGWINNYYGPTGVVMGASVGLIRTLHCDPDIVADIIPADYVINNIIVAAWDTAKRWQEKQQKIVDNVEEPEKHEDPTIYNSVSSCQNPIQWGEYMALNAKEGKNWPNQLIMWYYFLTLNKHKWIDNVYIFFLHLLPATVVDMFSILVGRKPMLLKAYGKIHKFSGVLSYFSTQQWTFNNDNVLALWERTNPVDREKYEFNVANLDWKDYFRWHIMGIRVYLLKDPLETVERSLVRYKWLTALHYSAVTVFLLLIAWAVKSLTSYLLS